MASNERDRLPLVAAGDSSHVVQFYDDEAFLHWKLGQYIGEGLEQGEPCLVFATEARRRGLLDRLKHLDVDVEEPLRTGQLWLCDAEEALATFLVDDMLDPVRFTAAVGGILEARSTAFPGKRVRAFGEMVDLLCRDGNPAAAVKLEELWNDLGKSHPCSLLCAYGMGRFQRSADRAGFEEICNAHTEVVPVESYTLLTGDEERLREITALQQRARSLEKEIEQRKQLEASLAEALKREMAAREAAERAVRLNEMVAAVLAHDLRTPLSAIATGATYLEMSQSGDVHYAATRIVASAERMRRLIDQLLDFSRIRTGGGLVLNPVRLDLGDLCRRVKDELEVAHPGRSIELELQGDTTGCWDFDRLLQVLSNLMGNAIEHGSSGCLVRVEGEGAERVAVTVSNGGEVKPELLPVLFEPFRGDRDGHQKGQGLGLGLFITRKIVLAHGGTIEVTSTEAEGTRFRLQLPRRFGLLPAALR